MIAFRRSAVMNCEAAPRRGFTLIEAMVAIVLLSVGFLALAKGSGHVAKLLGEGRRASMAGAQSFQRLESLRTVACLSRTNGSDSVQTASGKTISRSSWTFSDLGKSTYRVRLVVTYLSRGTSTKADTLDQEVSCLR
jgi:prepilin-type N-terminal cleavage/methylation domain-containing protein